MPWKLNRVNPVLMVLAEGHADLRMIAGRAGTHALPDFSVPVMESFAARGRRGDGP
jgi:hypothetical protein